MCKQCDLRKGMALGGLNTKGPGPGGVAFRSVPAHTPERAALLQDLGGEHTFAACSPFCDYL